MVRAIEVPLANILPITTGVTDDGHLTLGGCDAVALAGEFGTPLYVFDEETLRGQCRAFQEAFQSRYHNSIVAYAAKAYLGRAMAGIIAQEGMSLDIVSGGELAVAASVGFPAERIHFHGNNKSEQELREALDFGVARIVVDNFHELQLLNGIAQGRGIRQKVLLRLSPGIDPHTHVKTTTGTLENKFGIPLPTGQAEAAVRQALDMPGLELVGLHVHLGSPVFELEPYAEAVDTVLEFASNMRKKYEFEMAEFSPGGGFAVAYTPDQQAPEPAVYAETVTSTLRESLWRYELPAPQLIVEPGRSIVARAAVALYTVGSSKEVPGVKRFVSVDGGMADNIRPALYESRYAAVVANRVHDNRREIVTVAGKYCESGDILMADAELPTLEAGDILAMPAAGGYALAMASNYNLSLRPPVILVKDGDAKVMRRRETYEDLTRADVWPLE
ncbi:MAG TPA: diaminopimelate decarboxylase [Dehalococcoidia bacterium]|nr:diaminopimelate decarboxylase [Dehalococcoidia bacterium]